MAAMDSESIYKVPEEHYLSMYKLLDVPGGPL